jgi:predicted outer membrane lipoprotein
MTIVVGIFIICAFGLIAWLAWLEHKKEMKK